MNSQVICSDHRDSESYLKSIPDLSIDSIVTDPPYELGFMGKKWNSSGIAYDINIWKECLRVLKPGGYLLAFGCTRTSHRMICTIEDAGFEIRDSIQWIYGSGFPKSMNVGKIINLPEWEGWGTALKPAHEPICVARKPIEENSVAANMLKYGTGGINIDASRVQLNGESNPSGSAKRIFVKNQYSDEKIYGENKITPNAGRFPANVILDEEAGKLLDEQAPATGACAPVKVGQRGESRGVYGDYAQKGDNGRSFHDGKLAGASRFFYCAKASRAERDKGLNAFLYKEPIYGKNMSSSQKGTMSGSIYPIKNTHPTVKPVALMVYLCRLVTPFGGTILDLFAGSGTTGIGAKIGGFSFIGIDKEQENCEIAIARIAAYEPGEDINKKIFQQDLPFK